MYEQKEFCANPMCPFHKLPMVDSNHYHTVDSNLPYKIENGVIYTVPINIVTTESKGSGFFKAFIPNTKYFCETCANAIKIARK